MIDATALSVNQILTIHIRISTNKLNMLDKLINDYQCISE